MSVSGAIRVLFTRRLPLTAAAVSLVVLHASSAAAATFTVTNIDDAGVGSLRQAILDANANAGPDVIEFDSGVFATPRTITVSPANRFMVITDSLTVNGPGEANLTISGGALSRILWIQNGAVTIQNLTLADGLAKGGNGGGGGMGAGGAIFVHEGKQGATTLDVATGSISLSLINVTLKNNAAQGGTGGSGFVTGGGGLGGNGNTGGAAGGVLGNAVGYEYGGSVTDATTSTRGTNGGIAIFGSGGREGSPDDAGFGGGGGGDEDGGFAGGGGGATFGGGSFGRGGFGGGGGNAGADNNFTNNGGARGGFGGGGGALAFRGNGSNGDGGLDDGQGGFGGGNGTTVGGGGMGAGGALFIASGTVTLTDVTFENNTASRGTGGNNGKGLGGAIFVFKKSDNGSIAAPGTTHDPSVSGTVTFTGNAADDDAATTGNNDDVYGPATLTPPNAAPTVTGATLTRQQGSPASSSSIATVADAEDAENTLTVSATLATGSGISISSLSTDTLGNVTALVGASCSATSSTFGLLVTDSGSKFANGTLTVNVSANTAPTLGSYPTTNLTPGAGTIVTPGAAPADNGSVNSISAAAPGFTGTFSVDINTGAVTVANAGPNGTYTVTVTATDNCGTVQTSTFTLQVGNTFTFTGFFSPIDNAPTVNVLTAGTAVPVKFSLGGNQGLAIFAPGYPLSQPIACSNGTPTDNVEETAAAGGSAITFDAATGQYKYVWKTEKAWKNSCRQLLLRFTDGSTRMALFRFK